MAGSKPARAPAESVREQVFGHHTVNIGRLAMSHIGLTWYLLPLAAAISLVYSAKRYESTPRYHQPRAAAVRAGAVLHGRDSGRLLVLSNGL